MASTNDMISKTDFIVSLGKMFQESSLESLPRVILPVKEIPGPDGGFTNIIKNSNGDIAVVRSDFTASYKTPIKTGFSTEAAYDLLSIYGLNAIDLVNSLFKGSANELENEEFITFLDNNSVVMSSVILKDSDSIEDTTFRVMQRVGEAIVTMNSKKIRTFNSFAILPLKIAASILQNGANGVAGLSRGGDAIQGGEIKQGDVEAQGLFIIRIGQTSYYLNPNPDATEIYVGLFSKKNFAASSALFNPYFQKLYVADDPDNGNQNYLLNLAFSISLNPLHTEDNPMLIKFGIEDISSETTSTTTVTVDSSNVIDGLVTEA